MMKRVRRGRPEKRLPWVTIILGGLIVLGGLSMLLGRVVTMDRLGLHVNQAADRWQKNYWQRPIPLQGPVPAGHLPQTAGLRLENCAACHVQAADLRQSIHGAAMGPGVTGQLPGMTAADRATCLECHAPLSEQWAELPNGAAWTANPAFDSKLQAEGLVCASCHLRGHVRNGPLLVEGKASISQIFHGQPVRTAQFEASEFCKACHQHEADAQAPNGKPVENTYREWLDSPAAKEGKTCQSCHMPDRRHLWKGIHDPEMTRSGVTVETAIEPREPRQGQSIKGSLSLKNTGVGHAFPTYTTPAVYLRAAFVDAAGKQFSGKPAAEMVLQRKLDMSTEPWGEVFDTRVLPGKTATLVIDQTVPAGARSLRLWIAVEPDEFYAEFFEERLAERPAPEVARQYRSALRNTRQTPYVLFDTTIPVVAAH